MGKNNDWTLGAVALAALLGMGFGGRFDSRNYSLPQKEITYQNATVQSVAPLKTQTTSLPHDVYARK